MTLEERIARIEKHLGIELPRMVRVITVDEIINAVCKEFMIATCELVERNREPRVCHPRQVVMYLAHRIIKPKPSFQRIALWVGVRNHATAMHGCKVTAGRMVDNDSFRHRVEKIERELVGG